MSDERKKSGLWPCIMALLIGLPVLYVASFGPACWITSRMNVGSSTIGVIYRPIVQVMWWTDSGSIVGTIVDQYSTFAAADDWHWMRVDLFGPDPGGPVHIWVCSKK
jgi:hypothetical protein